MLQEDIGNPPRRTNLPILLGTSPPRGRVFPRNLRSTLIRRQGKPFVWYFKAVDYMYTGSSLFFLMIVENSAVASNLEVCPLSEPEILPVIPTSTKVDSSNGIYCPVCLDTLSQVKEANHQMQSTTCGHIFCGPCITKVVAATQQCPTCRKRLDMRKIHPIFI